MVKKSVAGAGGAQSKTERQQALNKAAQQRYRERKKAKAQELEHAVRSLQDKVNELTVVSAEKAALQVRTQDLDSVFDETVAGCDRSGGVLTSKACALDKIAAGPAARGPPPGRLVINLGSPID